MFLQQIIVRGEYPVPKITVYASNSLQQVIVHGESPILLNKIQQLVIAANAIVIPILRCESPRAEEKNAKVNRFMKHGFYI